MKVDLGKLLEWLLAGQQIGGAVLTLFGIGEELYNKIHDAIVSHMSATGAREMSIDELSALIAAIKTPEKFEDA